MNGIKTITSSEKLLSLDIPVKKSTFLMIPFYVLYSLFALMNNSIFGILLFVLLFSAAIMVPLNSIIRSRKAGIYKKGIIYPQNQYQWNTIEAYAIIENGIRFIHKETGAFDINADERLKNDVKVVMQSFGIKEIEIA
jgi:hypothetical protein